MTCAEFSFNKFDFESKKLIGSDEDTIIVAVSMLPEEAEVRIKAAVIVEGVTFVSYTKEEFEKFTGNPSPIIDGRIIGRTQANNWEVMGKYGAIVKKKLRKKF